MFLKTTVSVIGAGLSLEGQVLVPGLDLENQVHVLGLGLKS